MTEFEYDEAKQSSIRRTQEATNQWLRERGFWFVGQNKAGLMKRLAEFRATSVQKPAGRDWARILKSKILDGKCVPLVCEQMVSEALRCDFNEKEEAA